MMKMVRLCRLMCGKASPFRLGPFLFGVAPLFEAKPLNSFRLSPERQSLSAHQAAKPLRNMGRPCGKLTVTKTENLS
jgi:hypothetical protein